MTDAVRLDDRVAVVTGAAGGIGRAIAAVLVERGACVVLGDRDPAVARAARDLGPRAHAIEHDVTDLDATRAVVAVALERFARLDVWINNAGYDRSALFADTGPEEWRGLVDVNHIGVLNGCIGVLDALKAAPSGRRDRLHHLRHRPGRGVGRRGLRGCQGSRGGLLEIARTRGRA